MVVRIKLWANFVIFQVVATQQRFISPIQLLLNNELFHQSSFYLRNIVSSFQLLFQQRCLHFSPGEMSGGIILDPARMNKDRRAKLCSGRKKGRGRPRKN